MKKRSASTRFNYEGPSFWVIIAASFFQHKKNPPIRALPKITDYFYDEVFYLTEEENMMMELLYDYIYELSRRGEVSFLSTLQQRYKDWVFRVRDRVLAAIVNRRRGDATEWKKLKQMEPDEWFEWLRDA